MTRFKKGDIVRRSSQYYNKRPGTIGHSMWTHYRKMTGTVVGLERMNLSIRVVWEDGSDYYHMPNSLKLYRRD